jgi:transposase
VAEPSAESVINDERWAFVQPWLPPWKRRKADGLLSTRAVLAAVVYVVTADIRWGDLPLVFEVTPEAARYRFQVWTDADLWRRLAVAAISTPHERWGRTVADAAIHRAGTRAVGYPQSYPTAMPELVDEPTCTEPPRPAPPPRRTLHSADEYTEARDAMNRPDNTAL